MFPRPKDHAMIHELRSYTIKPGRMEDCHRVFESACLPVFRAVGISMLGFWEPEPKDGRTFIYLLGFADAAAREKAWPAFIAHPQWVAAKAALAGDNPWEKVQATVLTPTRYSPA
jgi:NIPSNAP